MNQPLDFIFQIIVLIFSVVVHEVSHGLTAYSLGDTTAKDAGRLTLNPLKHLDPFGSFLLPLLLYIAHLPVFGSARPVPYNPHNLRNPRRDAALVALAGPASNILIALVFGFIIRLLPFFPIHGAFAESFASILSSIVFINLLLAIFNLVPIPPLDGSKILFSFFPYSFMPIEQTMERYGFVILLVFIFFFFRLLAPIIFFFFRLTTGISLSL